MAEFDATETFGDLDVNLLYQSYSPNPVDATETWTTLDSSLLYQSYSPNPVDATISSFDNDLYSYGAYVGADSTYMFSTANIILDPDPENDNACKVSKPLVDKVIKPNVDKINRRMTNKITKPAVPKVTKKSC